MFAVLLIAVAPAPHREPPPAADAWKFPPHAVCRAQLDFCDAFRAKLQRERECWPESVQYRFDLADREAAALREIWSAAWHAGWYYEPHLEWQRRVWLGTLRELLGDADYDAGRMPPIVPVWRYRSLR